MDEEKYLDDQEQWEYVQAWMKRKNARKVVRKHHWMMVKIHLEAAFEHLVMIFKGGEVK